MKELTFRAATEADIPFLLELRRQTMSEYLQRSGVEPSQSERLERVLANFDCAEIILLSGAPVGLLKVVRSPDSWDLIQIQILPEKQGGGLGSSILGTLLADADEAHASVSLSVLRANPARRLYERLGFRIVAENDHAYDMLYGGEPMLDFAITGSGPLSRLARSYTFSRFAGVSEAVRALPYGRNRARGDIAAVLKEQRGTCSSKHRFLAALAHECGHTDVQLMVGLYEMSERNTPGISRALGELSAIPEAHCYLAHAGNRFDFTGLPEGDASPFQSLLEERSVSPADLPAMKLAYHRQAVEKWARSRGLDLDVVWAVRERCIALLTEGEAR